MRRRCSCSGRRSCVAGRVARRPAVCGVARGALQRPRSGAGAPSPGVRIATPGPAARHGGCYRAGMKRILSVAAVLGLSLATSACLVTTSSRPMGPSTPGTQPPPPPPPAAVNGVLIGTIVDVTTQQPIDRAGIELNGGGGRGTGKNAQTDTTGTFRMPELTPGSYGMRCSREGYLPQEQTIQIRAGETTQISCALRKK